MQTTRAGSAPDLGKTPPRSGRAMLGEFSWLARLADKARAHHAGTVGEYVAYCGLSTGFLDRCGVSVEDFDRLVRDGASDEQLLSYFRERVSTEQRARANHYVLVEQKHHLDKEDAEEGWVAPYRRGES